MSFSLGFPTFPPSLSSSLLQQAQNFSSHTTRTPNIAKRAYKIFNQISSRNHAKWLSLGCKSLTGGHCHWVACPPVGKLNEYVSIDSTIFRTLSTVFRTSKLPPIRSQRKHFDIREGWRCFVVALCFLIPLLPHPSSF